MGLRQIPDDSTDTATSDEDDDTRDISFKQEEIVMIILFSVSLAITAACHRSGAQPIPGSESLLRQPRGLREARPSEASGRSTG